MKSEKTRRRIFRAEKLALLSEYSKNHGYNNNYRPLTQFFFESLGLNPYQAKEYSNCKVVEKVGEHSYCGAMFGLKAAMDYLKITIDFSNSLDYLVDKEKITFKDPTFQERMINFMDNEELLWNIGLGGKFMDGYQRAIDYFLPI